MNRPRSTEYGLLRGFTILDRCVRDERTDGRTDGVHCVTRSSSGEDGAMKTMHTGWELTG